MYLKQEVGRAGEEKACIYLKNNNYAIIERNFYCNNGEIDAIAIDLKTSEIVFLEIKSRTNNKYGTPAESVNKIKQKHIKDVARYYLYKNKIENSYIRFDIMEVYMKEKKINHIKDAFI